MVAAVATTILSPVLFLYALDLVAGTMSPDIEWALAAIVGLCGLWAALLLPEPLLQQYASIRWVIIVTLVVMAAAFLDLAWGSLPGLIVVLIPVLVALHQTWRLIPRRD